MSARRKTRRGVVSGFFHRHRDGIGLIGALAGIVGLVVALIALVPTFRGTFLAENANRIAMNSDLSVVRVDVASTTEVMEESWFAGERATSLETRRIEVGAAKIILHNSGEQAALIDELRVHVSKVWAPEGCHGAGPGLTSVLYDFTLPGDILDKPLPATSSKKIDFEVAAQSNDRLAVTIGEESLGEAGWPWIVSASAELVLADDRTVRTGEFILMNNTGVDRVVELVAEGVVQGYNRGECVQRNIRMLEEVMRAPGHHSPAIPGLIDRLAEMGFTATSFPPDKEDDVTPAPVVNPYLNTWVAQLGSFPESSTSQDDLRAAEEKIEARMGVDVETAHSSAYGSLTPGYWVVFHPGPFADGKEALTFCAERGITDDNSCVGRYFSASAADKVLTCRGADPPDARNCVRH